MGRHGTEGDAVVSGLEITWESRQNAHSCTHEARVGQQCLVIVTEWSFGQTVDWRVTVLDDRATNTFTRVGKADVLEEAKTQALAAVDGTVRALRRAIGPDLAAAIRQAQASVEKAREAAERGEWAEPETIAAGSLAQLAALVGVQP